MLPAIEVPDILCPEFAPLIMIIGMIDLSVAQRNVLMFLLQYCLCQYSYERNTTVSGQTCILLYALLC